MTQSGPYLFISYRRGDSLPHARLLALSLKSELGAEVFFDLDSISPGAEFPAEIARRIGDSDAVLVVIGDGWKEADVQGQRRIDDPNDWIRREVALALSQEKLTIPVLVEGATMPAADELPDEIAGLAARNAVTLSDGNWTHDFARLARALEGIRGGGRANAMSDSGSFPNRFSDRWFEKNVPEMDDTAFERLVGELTRRSWRPDEIEARVMPHTSGRQGQDAQPVGDEIDEGDSVARALSLAARAIEQLELAREKPIRERDLADALGSQLARSRVERKLTVPGWDPQPGAVDVFTVDARGNPVLVIETKLKSDNALFECLWDAAKVLSLTRLASVEAAYLVAGTTNRNWQKPIDCADMFNSGRYELVGTIERYSDWWEKYILGDSTGRPELVPDEMDVELVASVELKLGGRPWELRAIRVQAVDDDWIPFTDGRPDRS